MRDRRTRELGRAEDDAEKAAAHVGEVVREGGDEMAIALALLNVQQAQRVELLESTALSEEQRSVIEALGLIVEQIEPSLSITALFEVKPEEGDLRLPTPDEIMKSIRAHLTSRQVQEILNYKEPRLYISPIVNTKRYEEALHHPRCRNIAGQQAPQIWSPVRDVLDAQTQEKITGYQWTITDGAQVIDLLDWDDVGQELGARLNRFNAHYENTGIQRLDARSVAVALMDSLEKGKPLGCQYEKNNWERSGIVTWQCTLLQELDGEHGLERVGEATWSWIDRMVVLDFDWFSSVRRHARFRSAVTGQVEMQS